jgi:hypothetical protein
MRLGEDPNYWRTAVPYFQMVQQLQTPEGSGNFHSDSQGSAQVDPRAARLEFARPGSENAHETYKFSVTATNGTNARRRVRQLFPSLGSASATMDNRRAHSTKLAFLVGGGLLCGRDPEIKNGAFH